MKKETLLSLSEKTGFSVSTVSRVLSGKGRQYRICDKTINHIIEVARSCNYSPDLIAQSLRVRKTNTVGLTVPNIANPFFATLASVIINQFKDRGYNTIIADTMENEKNEMHTIRSYVARKVDGIIAVPVGTSPDFLEEVSRTVPVVLIDRYFENTNLPYVCTDNYTGGYMAAEHLIMKGYKNILALQGVRTSMPNKERLRGVAQAVADHAGYEVRKRTAGDSFSVENGYREALVALSSDDRPDAIFAFSTTILLGVIRAVRELGLNVPGDVALVSFDNNLFLDYLEPSVTRIGQPVNIIGKLAADNMVKMMECDDDRTMDSSQILIRPTLIEGGSC